MGILILGLGLLLVGAAPLHAQTRYTVLPEPDGTAVGMAVLFQPGNAWESEREAGLTYFAAEAVAEQVRPRLHALGARVAVRCNVSAVGYTLLLPADGWAAAAALFLDALFDRETDEAAVERARGVLTHKLTGTDGVFTRQLRKGLSAALHPGSRRWAHDPCDPSGALADADAEDVRRWARTRLLSTRATAAIAGPVDEEAARRMLGRTFGSSELPLLVPAPVDTPQPGTDRIEHNIVTSWMAVAFPFTRSADVEALRMLAYALDRSIRPSADRPELFDSGTELRYHGEGGVLVVYTVLAPDETDRWAQRIQELVAELGDDVDEGESFESLLRRYRGQRLLGLATPEARAHEAAFQLFFEGRYRPPAERLADLMPDRLRAAAASLAEPMTVILGPAPP